MSSTATTWSCAHCSLTFDKSKLLERHALQSGHKAYRCTKCTNKSFGKRTALIRHNTTHLDKKAHACRVCKKAFFRKDHCQEHEELCTHRLARGTQARLAATLAEHFAQERKTVDSPENAVHDYNKKQVHESSAGSAVNENGPNRLHQPAGGSHPTALQPHEIEQRRRELDLMSQMWAAPPYNGSNFLPKALLEQYPALASIDFSSPPAMETSQSEPGSPYSASGYERTPDFPAHLSSIESRDNSPDSLAPASWESSARGESLHEDVAGHTPDGPRGGVASRNKGENLHERLVKPEQLMVALGLAGQPGNNEHSSVGARKSGEKVDSVASRIKDKNLVERLAKLEQFVIALRQENNEHLQHPSLREASTLASPPEIRIEPPRMTQTPFVANYGAAGQARQASQSQQDAVPMPPSDASNFLPKALLEQYPSLAGIDFSTPDFPASRPSMESPGDSSKAVSEHTPEFPAQIVSMESSVRESLPENRREKSDEAGKYICTYHGCSLRFQKASGLHRHKGKAHRGRAAQQTADSDVKVQGSGQDISSEPSSTEATQTPESILKRPSQGEGERRSYKLGNMSFHRDDALMAGTSDWPPMKFPGIHSPQDLQDIEQFLRALSTIYSS